MSWSVNKERFQMKRQSRTPVFACLGLMVCTWGLCEAAQPVLIASDALGATLARYHHSRPMCYQGQYRGTYLTYMDHDSKTLDGSASAALRLGEVQDDTRQDKHDIRGIPSELRRTNKRFRQDRLGWKPWFHSPAIKSLPPPIEAREPIVKGVRLQPWSRQWS